MVDEVGGPDADADGVLVISVWTRGAGGGMLARLTMSGAGESPQVKVVTSPDGLHSALDDWLVSLAP